MVLVSMWGEVAVLRVVLLVGAAVWLYWLVQLCGYTCWCSCVVILVGAAVWLYWLVQLCGYTGWCSCVVILVGAAAWLRWMAQLCGCGGLSGEVVLGVGLSQVHRNGLHSSCVTKNLPFQQQ